MADQATMNQTDGKRTGPAAAFRKNVAELGHDAATLVELQTQLLALDLKQAAGRAVAPVVLAMLGLLLLQAAFPVALVGGGFLLVEAGLAPAWAFLIAAGTALLTAAVLGLFAWRRLRGSLSSFSRSRFEFARNFRWVKQVLKQRGAAAE